MWCCPLSTLLLLLQLLRQPPFVWLEITVTHYCSAYVILIHSEAFSERFLLQNDCSSFDGILIGAQSRWVCKHHIFITFNIVTSICLYRMILSLIAFQYKDRCSSVCPLGYDRKKYGFGGWGRLLIACNNLMSPQSEVNVCSNDVNTFYLSFNFT